MPTAETAGGIVSDALAMTGSYGARETIQSDDMKLGLRMLSDMMDMWSNFSLACFEIFEQSAPLVPMQASYTIGPGGDFNMTRPLKILTDPGTAYIQDPNGNNYPMQVVPRDKWNLYSNRSSLVTSNFPNILFYDPQYPLGVINITPYPNIAYTMFWDSMLQFATYDSPTQQLSLPPGYAIAMKSNLAIILKPFFLDGQMDPVIPALASSSLGAIKRTNQRELYAIYDSEIVSRSSVQYNVYTDSVGSTIGVT